MHSAPGPQRPAVKGGEEAAPTPASERKRHAMRALRSSAPLHSGACASEVGVLPSESRNSHEMEAQTEGSGRGRGNSRRDVPPQTCARYPAGVRDATAKGCAPCKLSQSYACKDKPMAKEQGKASKAALQEEAKKLQMTKARNVSQVVRANGLQCI